MNLIFLCCLNIIGSIYVGDAESYDWRRAMKLASIEQRHHVDMVT
jgi:hypothetical protein